MKDFYKYSCPVFIEWEIIGKDSDENIIHHYKKENLVVNDGKVEMLKFIGNLSPAASGFLFLGVGACSIAADVTDNTLSESAAPGHEYIDDPARKWARGEAGGFLTTSDITSENFATACYTFTKKMVYKFVYGLAAAVDGTESVIVGPIQTYGLFSTWVLPATVDGSSGIMLNELVEPTSFGKSGTNSLTVYVTLRF